MDLQRQLLAELMNPLLPENRKDFKDPDVCKNFLVAFCPHEQFLNTKADLGRCNLVHDEFLKKDYEASAEVGKLGYEAKCYDLMRSLLNDLDRQIYKGNIRVDSEARPESDIGLSQEELREKIIIHEESIKELLPQVVSLGEAGNVHAAHKKYAEVEKLKAELDHFRTMDPSHPTYRVQKKMEVCEICGGFLANDNNVVRIEAHVTGKQHSGFMMIREFVENYQKKYGAHAPSTTPAPATAITPASSSSSRRESYDAERRSSRRSSDWNGDRDDRSRGGYDKRDSRDRDRGYNRGSGGDRRYGRDDYHRQRGYDYRR